MGTNNTKERLIDTAIDLIWQSSYGSVSVDDICKAADVKKGSFYHFFPSKIDLAIEAMEVTYLQFKPLLDDIFSASRPPIERFKRYIDVTYEKQKEISEKHGMVCGCPMVSLASEMAPQDELIRRKTDEIMDNKKRYYESTLRDMVAEGLLPDTTDISTKANAIYSFFMGQFVMARIQNSLEPLRRDLIQENLFKIIGVQENTVLEKA